jgi:hypothetical protein
VGDHAVEADRSEQKRERRQRDEDDRVEALGTQRAETISRINRTSAMGCCGSTDQIARWADRVSVATVPSPR